MREEKGEREKVVRDCRFNIIIFFFFFVVRRKTKKQSNTPIKRTKNLFFSNFYVINSWVHLKNQTIQVGDGEQCKLGQSWPVVKPLTLIKQSKTP